jgi:CubicO group peptidase (beta-lactamase class C family)
MRCDRGAGSLRRKVVMAKTSGFSRARLRRMSEVMRGFVERGEAAGIVTLLCRNDEVHVETCGVLDFGTRAPVERDSLFRIASMTKPIAAVAALMLVEEAKLRLDEPIAGFLPELAAPRVLRRVDSALDDTDPIERPITLRDLLTFRLGSGMLLERPSAPIQRALADAGIDLGPESPSLEPDVWIERFGKLPLMHQPGEQWMYHVGSIVLSVLIRRVSGMSFESFLQERIFGPLGMNDTSFIVPESQRARLATPYEVDLESRGLFRYALKEELTYPAGATGLISTADDYLAFGRMLLRYGRVGKQRLLARPTVEVMTTDQLTLAQKAASPFFPGYWATHGWGFGVSVVTARDDIAAVPGRFGWDGAFGTSWYSDPTEDLVAILMTQRYANPIAAKLNADFLTLAYQAIDD